MITGLDLNTLIMLGTLQFLFGAKRSKASILAQPAS